MDDQWLAEVVQNLEVDGSDARHYKYLREQVDVLRCRNEVLQDDLLGLAAQLAEIRRVTTAAVICLRNAVSPIPWPDPALGEVAE